VCAVSPAELVHRLPATLSRQPVVALNGGTLTAILEGFLEVARVLGCPARGEALALELKSKLSNVRERVRSLPRPRVACVEWIEPVFTMGNWGPELVEVAGGENLLGVSGAHSTTTPFDAVVAADPDVLVVAPCGFGLERAESELPALTSQPGFRELRAVRNGRVYVCDGNLYFNRSSPSLFETAAILAEMLHPTAFPPSHEGTAWRRVASR
jgi:iron complex transport system substrate-binding protein